MDINVIITFSDKEDQLPYLFQILSNYKVLKPTVLTVYTGDKQDVKANLMFKVGNPYQKEYAMIVEGHRAFRNVNKNKRFLKLSSHTWPTDENKLVELFNKLDETKTPIASNYWINNQPGSLATDILIMDLAYGNIFSSIDKFYQSTEITMFKLLDKFGKVPYIIPEREPVHWNNLWECSKLKWTMYSNLQQNVSRAEEFLSER